MLSDPRWLACPSGVTSISCYSPPSIVTVKTTPMRILSIYVIDINNHVFSYSGIHPSQLHSEVPSVQGHLERVVRVEWMMRRIHLQSSWTRWPSGAFGSWWEGAPGMDCLTGTESCTRQMGLLVPLSMCFWFPPSTLSFALCLFVYRY